MKVGCTEFLARDLLEDEIGKGREGWRHFEVG